MQGELYRDALLAWFHAAGTPDSEWRVGGEFEKEYVDLSSGRRIEYGEPDGVRDLLATLSAAPHWTPVFEGEHLIGLNGNDGSTITLEPGGQVELSTAPLASLHTMREILAAHIRELEQAAPTGRGFLATGYTPFQDIAELPFVPKGRYAIMRDYLGPRGALAHHMMKGTSSVQAAFDYRDEIDAGRKLTVALELSPLVTAWLANSPLRLGRPTGDRSFRGRCWLETDPARTGVLDAVTEGGFAFSRYLDYLLRVPMMFVHRGGGYIDAGGRSFGQWMEAARPQDRPTWHDWDLHLTSVFPEVRMKHFIEVRGGDEVQADLALAAVALWRGLLYGDNALFEAEMLVTRLVEAAPRAARFEAAVSGGLLAELGGRSLRADAEEMFSIAASGLVEQGRSEEVRLLMPLKRYLSGPHGCPADETLALLAEGADVGQIVEFLRYRDEPAAQA